MQPRSRDCDDRRTLDDLINRYRYHPEFRDVYVEGEWDKRIVDWLLRCSGVRGIAIYDINSINVPTDILTRHGLRAGNKERVVALAHELENRIADPRQVTCIIDNDFDLLLDITHSSCLLRKCDFSCFEMYLVNAPVMDKFLTLVVRSYPYSGERLINEIVPTLQELHLLRATNLSLGWGMKWVPIDKCCTYKEHSLYFDGAEFISRYLSKSSKLDRAEEFRAELKRLRRKLSSDPRQHISKSDLFALLAEILPSYCKDHAFHDAGYIARSLAACVETAHLVGQPLFQQLVTELRS